MDKLLTMSTKEINRLEVMKQLEEKRKTQKEVAKILDLSERQIKRIWERYREKGAEGLNHWGIKPFGLRPVLKVVSL